MRTRSAALALGATALLLLMIIPLILTFGASKRNLTTGNTQCTTPTVATKNTPSPFLAPSMTMENGSPSKPWIETAAGPMCGAAVGFILSTVALLIMRRYDRSRDEDLLERERRHTKETRDFDFQQSSAEILTRFEVDRYEREIAGLEKKLAERQATLCAVEVIGRLGDQLSFRDPPDASSLRTLEVFPLAFSDEQLQGQLRELETAIRVYLAIPTSIQRQQSESFARIRSTIPDLRNEVKTEFDSAISDLARKKGPGRNSLAAELANLRSSATGTQTSHHSDRV